MKKLKKVKHILLLLTLTIVNLPTFAQVKLMPLSKINDGYLSLQGNRVPIYESLQSGDFCLFDQQWCLSDDPQMPYWHIYDGGLNENSKVALLDHQLVMIDNETLNISNGFFMLENLMGELRAFKRTGYMLSSDIKQLTKLPLQSYVNKHTHLLQEVEFTLAEEDDDSEEVNMSYNGDTKWISRAEALRLLQEHLQADEFGMVAVYVDGVLVYMNKGSLGGLVNATRAIEVSV